MNPTTHSGSQAIVITRAGEAFEGHARVEGDWVHVTGRRRIGLGADCEYWDEVVERTWPSREIRVVRWTAQQDRVTA